jgi:hypothetical protein
MNYYQLKRMISEEHREEFINLLPQEARIKSKTEYISPDRQNLIKEAEESAFQEIAKKYGYEIDDESFEDEEDAYDSSY